MNRSVSSIILYVIEIATAETDGTSSSSPPTGSRRHARDNIEAVNQYGSKNAVSGTEQMFTIPKTDTTTKGYRIIDFIPISDNLTPAEFLVLMTDSFLDMDRLYNSSRTM